MEQFLAGLAVGFVIGIIAAILIVTAVLWRESVGQ